MDSPATPVPANGHEMSVDPKSPQAGSAVGTQKSRSRSRDRHSHSSRSHRERSDRDRDRRDRDRGDERRGSKRSRSPAGDEDRRRSERRHRDDRDRDRHDRPRDRDRERDRDRDRDSGRDRDRDRDRDRRRRRDDPEGTPPPRDERSSKRARADMDVDHPTKTKTTSDDPADPSLPTDPTDTPAADGAEKEKRLIDRVSKPDVRSRSQESDRRSKRSDDGSGGGRRGSRRDDRDRDRDRSAGGRGSRSPPRRRSPPPRRGQYDDGPGGGGGYGRRRSPPPRRRRASPSYDSAPPPNEDSEARSVFVSQLAARMTTKDLGFFFEEHLGEGSVIDPRIVTDRLSRRSKGIAYVELANVELVQKAIDLTGTVVMGLPIRVTLTEAERNKQPSASDPTASNSGGSGGGGPMQLYVGSLHFNLTDADIKQVFEPFGELEFVDLHRDSATGRSKGYAFVQFKRSEDAKMALEQMEGFELAGRQLRVNTVHEKGSNIKIVGGGPVDSLDENGGSLNNNSSRHMLMQKLARTEAPVARPAPIMRPNIPEARTRNVALKNMFDPAEETEQDWDTELADDVKGECSEKYGPVTAIKVIKESQGEIYVQFENVDDAVKAHAGLNGRWFGGRLVSASHVSDVIIQAYL